MTTFTFGYIILSFSDGSAVKKLPTMQETQFQFLGQKDPPKKEITTHFSILAWRIPWAEETAGYVPWGCKESDMT